METLAGFAERYGISFPLLSDEGSAVIRRLGMLDEDLDAHQAVFGFSVEEDQRGVAYPGVFVLDEYGIVIERRFGATYRDRDGGASLLEEALGIATPPQGPSQERGGKVVRIRASVDAPGYHRYQWLRLLIDLDVIPGWHVYADPVPEGYVALHAEIGPIDGLEVGRQRWPEPHPFRVEGLDEDFFVLEGRIRGSVPFALKVPPDAGDQTLPIRVSYQACSASECLRPSAVSFELTIPRLPAPQ